MKVRVCYVSNSSSSSFLAIGKKVLFEDLKFEDGYTFIARAIRDYGDGDDVFEVTKELADYFKEKNINNNVLDRRFSLYKCSTLITSDYKVKERGIVIKKGESFIDLEKDYYSTDSLDTFISNYEYELLEYKSDDKSYSGVGLWYVISKDIKDLNNTFCYIIDTIEFNTYLVPIRNNEELIQAKRNLSMYKKDFFSILYKQNEQINEDISLKNCELKWMNPDKVFNSLKECLSYIENHN